MSLITDDLKEKMFKMFIKWSVDGDADDLALLIFPQIFSHRETEWPRRRFSLASWAKHVKE